MKESKRNKVAISVVIAMYNAEKYIEECIDSLIQQTFHDFEIIIIDDGSTDGSLDLCKKMSLKHHNIRLFHQNNKGLSAARNYGIEMSIGEFICFVDADDWVHPEMLEIHYKNILQYHGDLSICNYVKVYDRDDMSELGEITNNPVLVDKKELIRRLSTCGPNNKSEKVVLACNKLIHRRIFDSVMFVEKRWHEDEFIIHHYIDLATNIVETNAVLYYYRQHGNSFSENKDEIAQGHCDILDAIQDRLSLVKGWNDQELCHEVLKSYLENGTIVYLLSATDEIKKMRKKRIFSGMIKEMFCNITYLTKNDWIKYTRFLISPDKYRKRYWS